MAKKVNIIGAGIAGLTAGCHLRMKGYETEIFELHTLPGGLCTSWKKGDYTVDGCLHWLVGSGMQSNFRPLWAGLIDMNKITFFYHEEYLRLEDGEGNTLIAWTDAYRLREELLRVAPEDEGIIREFIDAVLKLTRFRGPVEKAPELMNFSDKLKMMWKMLPFMGLFRKHINVTAEAYAAKCKNPLLRKFFEFGFMPEMSVLFFMFTMAWMHNRDNGYPIGGSLQFSRLLEQKYLELGGKIRYQARVDEILTESCRGGHRATGIRIQDGSVHPADIIVSAADSHDTLFRLLGGKFNDGVAEKAFASFKAFPSIIQVSFGLNGRFEGQSAMVYYPLDEPLRIDPQTTSGNFGYHLYTFDPTLAPEGKTVMTVSFTTENYTYWEDLRKNNREQYQEEKSRIAEAVTVILGKRFPDFRSMIEMTDVATPATLIRYTNNWKGSFEGWIINKESGFNSLRKTLPGLSGFYMAGQWLEPGGGVPAALLSGRNAAQLILSREK